MSATFGFGMFGFNLFCLLVGVLIISYVKNNLK
mgnify:FL=1